MCPNLLGDSKGTMSPSCPITELSPRNSESWDLCPPGPHTPLHVPIWVSPGLRSKMDLLFAWPHPLESERPHCGMRLGRICKEGGRGGRRSSSCPEWPLAVCVLLGITSSLWGLGFPSYKLFPLKPAPLPSFPSREQPDLFFNSYPGSLAIPLILSHITSAYTPNAVCH